LNAKNRYTDIANGISEIIKEYTLIRVSFSFLKKISGSDNMKGTKIRIDRIFAKLK